ncbi:hypothetical protein BN975_01269 [Mycolicibacterium farcinogenes]|nr:hypothetical protein BN975_01269 [Mycolicibacterium farcinogenes]
MCGQPVGHLAADHNVSAVAARAVDGVEHPLLGRRADQGADQGCGRRGITYRHGTERHRHIGDGLVEQAAVHQHPGVGGTGLPGVHACPDSPGDDVAGLGVIEHDHGRLAPEFEEGALHGVGAYPHQMPTDGRRPGERHHVDSRIGAQLSGYLIGRRRHDVDDTRRHIGALRDQASQASRIPRRVRIRFEHNGIACGQRRPQLVEDHLDRKVRRGDRGDHPYGFLDHRAGVALTEQAAAVEGPFPIEFVDQPGRIPQRIGQRPVQLGILRRHHRATHLGDQFLTQVVFFGLDRLLQLGQHSLPQSPVGAPVGFVERASGSADRGIHVLRTGRRGGTEEEAGGRAQVVEFGTGGRGDQFTVDKHALLGPAGGPPTDVHTGDGLIHDFAHAGNCNIYSK